MTVRKRLFDILLAGFGLFFLSPLFFILTLSMVMIDGFPVFFTQWRVGYHGKHFKIFKFRTMTPQSDGPAVTVGGDKRVTKMGRFLRRTKLDELPQLLNVIRGEMSLVGPRPEVPEYVALYSEVDRRVLELVPGVTDPASLRFFNEEALLAAQEKPIEFYVKTLMPQKIEINLCYGREASRWSDFALILKTIMKLGASKPISPQKGLA